MKSFVWIYSASALVHTLHTYKHFLFVFKLKYNNFNINIVPGDSNANIGRSCFQEIK